MKDERISLRIDKHDHTLLTNLSKQKNMSESELLREAIRSYLQSSYQEKACYDLAKNLGIIGIAKDLAKDLSTNKKHFEGFGE